MNHIKSLAFALLLALGSSACRVTSSYSYVSKPDTFTIAELTDGSGLTVEYRVVPSGRGGPAVHRVSARNLEVAYVGITPVSVDQSAANERGIEPWRGVIISQRATNSPAKAAGLAKGDVILSIAGEALTSAEQCKELIETRLLPEGNVDVVYLRRGDDELWTEASTTMAVRPKTINEASTDRFPLEAPDDVKQRIGLEVVTVPPNLADEIWSDGRSPVLVTGVVVGSSAYRAGIRQGDRVLECNGADIGSGAQISAILIAQAPEITLSVEGPLGPHTASVDTTRGIDVRSSTYIPILYDHESSVDRSVTGMLNFIFQFGFTKRHRYLPSSTREVAESSSLSILPLGLFEFSRSPTKSKNSIFWFINWSTRR